MSNSSFGPVKEGYLYIMRNPIRPDLYKIGRSKDPASRRKGLSATSVPEDYEALLAYPVRDSYKAESLAFALLDDFRYANRKEFFFASFDQIVDVCNQVQRHINMGVPLESSGITDDQIDKLTDPFSYFGE